MGYEVVKRPIAASAKFRLGGIDGSVRLTTSPSTALEPRGAWAFQTSATSSEAPAVWTLADPEPGDVLHCIALTIVSSSVAPIHINSNVPFSFSTGSTGHDMATLSTQGASFTAICLSTESDEGWLVTSIRSATFSTST